MGTARARGQTELDPRETNAEGVSAKFQTIVPKTEWTWSSGIPQPLQQICLSPLALLPLCSRSLTSLPTCGGPRHSQNSCVEYRLTDIHTHGCCELGNSAQYLARREQGTPLALPSDTRSSCVNGNIGSRHCAVCFLSL